MNGTVSARNPWSDTLIVLHMGLLEQLLKQTNKQTKKKKKKKTKKKKKKEK